MFDACQQRCAVLLDVCRVKRHVGLTLRLLILLPLMSTVSFAEPNQTPPELVPAVDAVYEVAEHAMNVGRRHYRIYSAVPLTAKNNVRPVLYMLDGNGQFPLAVNQATAQIAPEKLPVIIGIGYPSSKAYPTLERKFDYTPAVMGDEFNQGGGAASFLRFIQTTLKPWAEQRFPIDITQQTLFGHSFGGLFVLMVLQESPLTFQRYVAASPALWWGRGEMIEPAKIVAAARLASVTITLGEREEKPLIQFMSDKQRVHYQTRSSWISARRVCSLMALSTPSPCRFLLFADKSHGSVIPDAIATAITVTQQSRSLSK